LQLCSWQSRSTSGPQKKAGGVPRQTPLPESRAHPRSPRQPLLPRLHQINRRHHGRQKTGSAYRNDEPLSGDHRSDHHNRIRHLCLFVLAEHRHADDRSDGKYPEKPTRDLDCAGIAAFSQVVEYATARSSVSIEYSSTVQFPRPRCIMSYGGEEDVYP
jgi:hypothetical protein